MARLIYGDGDDDGDCGDDDGRDDGCYDDNGGDDCFVVMLTMMKTSLHDRSVSMTLPSSLVQRRWFDRRLRALGVDNKEAQHTSLANTIQHNGSMADEFSMT